MPAQIGTLKLLVDRLQIKFFRMKLPTSPTPEVLGFLMPWLKDDGQEFLVTRWPSHILWWAAPFTVEADGTCGRSIRWHDRLQKDFVPPFIPQVI